MTSVMACESERLSSGSGGTSSTASGGKGNVGGTGGASNVGQGLGCDHTAFSVNEDVVRSCVLKVSCSPFDPLDLISVCVSLNTQQTFKSSDCRGATTCDDIAKCTGEAFLTSACAATDPAWKCDGTLAVNCQSGYSVDCVVYGGTCALYTDPVAGQRARCQVLPSCTEAAGAYHCSGTVLYECVTGVAFGRDCAIGGGTCDETVAGDAHCRDPLPTCEADSFGCNGNVANECLDGTLYESECASVGLSCDSSSAYCLAPGCAPSTWESCSETCSGAQLTFCYGGVPHTVDCRDFGFSTCTNFQRADGAIYASCAG
ncbi:MAG: hypothetical protein QM756_27075 [Polyangiaceae bacterium]